VGYFFKVKLRKTSFVDKYIKVSIFKLKKITQLWEVVPIPVCVGGMLPSRWEIAKFLKQFGGPLRERFLHLTSYGSGIRRKKVVSICFAKSGAKVLFFWNYKRVAEYFLALIFLRKNTARALRTD